MKGGWWRWNISKCATWVWVPLWVCLGEVPSLKEFILCTRAADLLLV